MFSKEILIPIGALLIFTFAIVGMLFGDRLGWNNILYSIPPLAVLALFVGVFALQWKFMPKNLGGSTLTRFLILFGIAVVIAMVIVSLFSIL